MSTRLQVAQPERQADPITFQVIHSGLLSAAREMGTTMVRTSYSVIFSEGYDFSCAILNRLGQMVATVNFCPVHLAAMPYAAAWSIAEIGLENIHDGDVIVHNDPYRGGTHVSDVNVIKPIFFEGELIAFAANRGHQLDMGGKSPGGFAGDATEIFQEGLRIPPVKWYEAGTERRDVLDLILSNVRLPRVQLGDFKAQLASNTTAERRIQALCQRYGADTITRVMDEIMDYSERRMRSEIREIPDGVYAFEDWLDNDGITADPIRLYVNATVEGDGLLLDYSGSSEQVAGPVNATYGVTASSSFNALLEMLDPSIPVNQGAFRPVRIRAPRGSVVNPNFPAPVQGGNTNTSIALVSLIIGALAKALPHRALAASGGTCNDFTCGGFDRIRRQPFVFYWFPPTGWGALPTRDGWSAVSDPVSNCSDTPVEMMESLYPFVYERYELGTDCEGAGCFRGGYGITQELRTLADMTVSAIAERHVIAPYGLFGGGAALPNQFAIRRREDSEWRSFVEDSGVVSPSKFAEIPVRAGDTWRMRTTAGGGYGDPLERDPDAVLADVPTTSPSTARRRSS